MTAPFQLLRDALTRLGLDPQQQRRALAGAVVTDELALDLVNATRSLPAESERAGIALDRQLLLGLQELNEFFAAAPSDPLWDDQSLDTHPTWAEARYRARRLLAQLSPTGGDVAHGNGR